MDSRIGDDITKNYCKRCRNSKMLSEGWIKELKNRDIKEFRYKDLPKDLKKLGMTKKASAIDLIRKKKVIVNSKMLSKDIMLW